MIVINDEVYGLLYLSPLCKDGNEKWYIQFGNNMNCLNYFRLNRDKKILETTREIPDDIKVMIRFKEFKVLKQ